MTQLPRVMTLRDVVLFNITAIVGLRWLTTAGRVGPAGLVLWVIAMVIFFLPSAMAVRELADIDPGEGGIYRWATRAFGPRHGFLAGWGYWVNNLVYYPSLLLTSGAIVAYVGGPGFVHLAENKWFIAAFSLGNLWIAVGLNLVGLRVGKWVQNLGAYGTWLPAAIFVLLALWSFATHGSATPFTARALVPTHLDLPLLSLFATMTFAFAGLELAPTLGDEIRDPVATLRRGILLSGIGVVAMYVLGTAAMLVALPAETVSFTNGVPQAAATLVERLGAPWLAPAAALVALLLTLGNLGGVGAWIAGTARIPFVAGVDRVLPPAFGKVHPRWQTPYVALLVQGGVATVFVVAGLAGSTVHDAYLALVDTTIVLFFIPYLYLFAAYLRLRRERTPLGQAAGWAGLFAVLLSIGLAFVPAADVANPLAFEAKVVGGVVGVMGAGLEVRRYRAALLSQRAFSTLNAPIAAGVPQASPLAVSGVLRVPVVRFDYQNIRAPTTSPFSNADYDQVLFATVPPFGRPYTYHSFYDEMSNHLLDIEGQTFGPATLTGNEVTYTSGTSATCQASNPFKSQNCNGLFSQSAVTAMQQGLTEALRKLDATIDFTQFTFDPNTGVVSLVLFIQPALGGECGP